MNLYYSAVSTGDILYTSCENMNMLICDWIIYNRNCNLQCIVVIQTYLGGALKHWGISILLTINGQITMHNNHTFLKSGLEMFYIVEIICNKMNIIDNRI